MGKRDVQSAGDSKGVLAGGVGRAGEKLELGEEELQQEGKSCCVLPRNLEELGVHRVDCQGSCCESCCGREGKQR